MTLLERPSFHSQSKAFLLTSLSEGKGHNGQFFPIKWWYVSNFIYWGIRSWKEIYQYVSSSYLDIDEEVIIFLFKTLLHFPVFWICIHHRWYLTDVLKYLNIWENRAHLEPFWTHLTTGVVGALFSFARMDIPGWQKLHCHSCPPSTAAVSGA